MPELFDGVLAAGPVRAEVSDTAWLQAMLDAEAALAGAQADAGLIRVADAQRIAAACRADAFDPAELGAAATDVGNPAAPLVRALTAAAGPEVHRGATSQDIVDTAAMLVASRALDRLVVDLAGCTELVADLAEEHAATVHAGRTLLQQALPVTFGLTAAGWLVGLGDAADRVADVREHRLAVQLGGAAGTLASLGEAGPAVLAAMATRLGLAEPVLPWHTVRTRIADLAGALGSLCGVVATVARDITLFAQTEVGELLEAGPPGAGGSSTLPHKRNPVAAVAALAAAHQAPGLVATLLAAMEQEHQRAAGAWHAEWAPLTELLRYTGSAVSWLRTSLSRLQVDPARMRDNMSDLLLTERVTTELAAAVGRLVAHDAVTACCRRFLDGAGELLDVLAADPVVGAHVDRDRLAALLDPAGYLGSADVFVRRALAAHRARKER